MRVTMRTVVEYTTSPHFIVGFTLDLRIIPHAHRATARHGAHTQRQTPPQLGSHAHAPRARREAAVATSGLESAQHAHDLHAVAEQ